MTVNDPAEMLDDLICGWEMDVRMGVAVVPLWQYVLDWARSPEGARALFPELADAVDEWDGSLFTVEPRRVAHVARRLFSPKGDSDE